MDTCLLVPANCMCASTLIIYQYILKWCVHLKSEIALRSSWICARPGVSFDPMHVTSPCTRASSPACNASITCRCRSNYQHELGSLHNNKSSQVHQVPKQDVLLLRGRTCLGKMQRAEIYHLTDLGICEIHAQNNLLRQSPSTFDLNYDGA